MSLARVDNFRVSAGDRVDECARRRRDSRQQLHEVERGALADQQSRELALDLGEQVASLQFGAFGRERDYSRLGTRVPHHGLDQDAAGENHARFLDRDSRAAHRVRRDGRGGRDIALPHVLGERSLDEFGGIELLEQFHRCL